MQELLNIQAMETIAKQLGEVQQKIGQTNKEITNYVNFIGEKKFVFQETEDLEKSIFEAEGVLDQLIEVNDRKKLIEKCCGELGKTLKEIEQQNEQIVKRQKRIMQKHTMKSLIRLFQ